MATCPPTSTWTPTSISSCPAFCSKLGKDASSSPASTPTSAQCESAWTPALTHRYWVCHESISSNSIATVHECYVIELGIPSVSLEVLNHFLIFVFPGFPQGASQAEQISHPLPDPGNFWNVSWADGHPLPDHPNRHKFCPEWEYSGEFCCVKIENMSV